MTTAAALARRHFGGRKLQVGPVWTGLDAVGPAQTGPTWHFFIMAERRQFVVPELPVWEKKALEELENQAMRGFAATQFRHDIAWNEYRPLDADRSIKTWKAEKSKGGCNLTDVQKKTLNRAIQEGWFADGWDHPPGSRGADGKCAGPCCPAASIGDDYDPEGEDSGEDEYAPPKPNGPARFFGADEWLKWRFARAAFFGYFGSRALERRIEQPHHGGTRAGGTTGMFAC